MTVTRPVLKGLHSPDVLDLETHRPPDDEPFCVLVQAMFGPEGEDGEESFDLVVCNPPWIAERTRRGPFSGRHHLILARFDMADIRAFLGRVAAQSSAPTWQEVGEKLARHAHWEFEDYVPHP